MRDSAARTTQRGRLDRLADLIAAVATSLERRSQWTRRWFTPVTAAALVLLATIALFRMEASGANYDPQYMRVIVERAMRFGGSYYENGIHNKGPLEPVVYEVAARLGGDAGFWFVIGVFALIAAACVGVAAALFAIRSGASAAVAAAVATMAVVHLTLSEADYAGVLYARNMTVALLSAAFAVAAFDPAWTSARRCVAAAIVVGVATGLAVQTLLTACFTASPVLLWAMWTRRDVRIGRWPAWIVMPVVSAMALVSAPVFYLVTGSWRPFVNGWWVYARFMSTGTGRDLAGQVELGWDQLFEYYRDRPAVAITIQIWIVVSAVRWRQLDAAQRSVRVLAGVWFVGAWVELMLSQRYSSHYFSVLAAPTIMMIATLVGDVAHRWRDRFARRSAIALLPLATAVATLYAGGMEPFHVGVEAAGSVDSTDEFEQRRNAGFGGRTHMVRATLDLVSTDDDPLLMWTSFPWPYLDYERVSATRYIWKTFLLGEIYLGNSGPEYVLPGTWDRFADDLDRTDPTAFIVEAVTPLVDDTPFAERVEREFTEVFADDVLSLSYRDDLAEWLLQPAVEPATGASDLDLTALTSCTRIDADLSRSTLFEEPVRIEFADPDTSEVGASIDVSVSSSGDLVAESNRTGVAGFTSSSSLDADGRPVSLVVGARSAVVVIDGMVVGAVEIDRDAAVRIVQGAGALGAPVRSTPPGFTGC